jgi:hypothetical protein
VNTELKKTCGRKILSRHDAVVVNLHARPAKPVGSNSTGESLDFELDSRNEQ